MQNTSSEQETIEVDGITYDVLEKKPVAGKKFQSILYVKHGKRKFIVIQSGSSSFSKIHPLTNENE